VPQTLPGNKQLRGRFIAFLHRMVESLMSAVLPYLPPALEALMGSGADVADMSDVLALMVQLVQRFKEALAKLVEAALPVAVVKVHTLLGGLLLLARRPVLACCVLQKGSAAHANALLPSFMQGA
jgi:exportin-T